MRESLNKMASSLPVDPRVGHGARHERLWEGRAAHPLGELYHPRVVGAMRDAGYELFMRQSFALPEDKDRKEFCERTIAWAISELVKNQKATAFAGEVESEAHQLTFTLECFDTGMREFFAPRGVAELADPCAAEVSAEGDPHFVVQHVRLHLGVRHRRVRRTGRPVLDSRPASEQARHQRGFPWHAVEAHVAGAPRGAHRDRTPAPRQRGRRPDPLVR